MKLEEGMYVRYIPTIGEYTQKISKITKTKNCLLDMCYTLDDKEEVFSSHFDDILEASYNIIDLIQVGDYVNGSRVMKTNCKLEYIDDDSDTGVNEVYDGLELENGWIYFEHEINSIVTHEQMEIMSYKVEG